MTVKCGSISPKLSTIAHIKAWRDKILVLQTYCSELTDSHEVPLATKRLDLEPTQPSYGRFNLGLHVGDDPRRVHRHRCQLLSAINSELAQKGHTAVIRQLHWLNQVHGRTVVDIGAKALRLTAKDADAMVSTLDQCGLAIMTADCVPIVLYHPQSGKIGAIHAGWQGLANGVIQATAAAFGAPNEVVAWIGACISQANYEVGEEVVAKIATGCKRHQLLSQQDYNNLYQLISQPSQPTQRSCEYNGEARQQPPKFMVDLPKLASMQLSALGIKIQGITAPTNNADIPCSYASPQYYSYRQQTHEGRLATGRMALVIARI